MVNELELKKSFGNTLREFRKEQGLSQELLAAKVGLHRTYIGDVERGERNVSLVNIVKICEELNIPTSTFFSRMENGEKKNAGKSEIPQ